MGQDISALGLSVSGKVGWAGASGSEFPFDQVAAGLNGAGDSPAEKHLHYLPLYMIVSLASHHIGRKISSNYAFDMHLLCLLIRDVPVFGLFASVFQRDLNAGLAGLRVFRGSVFKIGLAESLVGGG
jgi:hypothetical protein